MTRIYLVSMTLLLMWMTSIDSGSALCSCYSLDGDIPRTWTRAQKLCKENNGELVSMETIEEWEFVKTQILNETTNRLAFDEWWIGLEKRDGRWEWLTNQTLTYNKWQHQKPDPNPKCIHVIIAKSYPPGTYGLFRNKINSLIRGTICEYKGQVNCNIPNRVSWCDPRTVAPTTSTTTKTNTLSQTPKIIYTTTDITGKTSSVPHYSMFSTVGPVEDSKQSFPTTIVASVIGVVLLSTCLVILACIWKRKKQDRKPRRNSHLSKKSRVPVKLEKSSSSNTNDVINSSDITVVSDNALQPESACASINDNKTVVNVTDGTSKEAAPVYASIKKNTNANQSNMSHVVYAELNDSQQAANQNSYHGNKKTDSIIYENEFQANKVGDNQSPHVQEGMPPEDNRLVYAQLAEFKNSDQQESSTKIPSPYKETEYATIMTPIICNHSKSKENISKI